MSEIVIGAVELPGANFQIGADIALTGLTVTLSNDQVTGSNVFPQRIVGMGGFKLTLPGGVFNVASVESRDALTLAVAYTGSSGTVSGTLHKYAELRIYALGMFTPFGSVEVVQQGTPGSSAWYRRFGASLINDGQQNVLHIPEITLPATTNSSNPHVRYFAGLYGTGGNLLKPFPVAVSEFRLNHAQTPTSWAQIIEFNIGRVTIPAAPENFYTEREIDSRFPTGLQNELLYFASAGNVLSRLTLDAGDFAINAGVLEALNVTKQLQEDGVDLPIRSKINFVGSSFTATDDAGNNRTNVTADSDLNAIASNASNGLYARTGAGTVAARTITGPAAGITVTDGDGVSGNPTLALANDLAALEGLGGTGLAARTAANTWTTRSLAQPAAGLTITNPAGIAGDPAFALANDLAAVEGLSTNGIVARTASETWTTRTITGPAAGLTVTSGDGVSGNPTLALANDLAALEGLGSTGIPQRTAADTWSIAADVTAIEALSADGVLRKASGAWEMATLKTAWATAWRYEIPPAATESLESVTPFICPTGTDIKVTKLRVLWRGGSHTNNTVLTWTLKRFNSSGVAQTDIGTITIDNSAPAISVVATSDPGDVTLSDGDYIVPWLTTRTGTPTETLITVEALGIQTAI